MRFRFSCAIVLSFLGIAPAAAQDSAARVVARSLYGDVAVIVQARPSQVRLGVDDGKKNIVLSLVATDVGRWADSTRRLVTRRRRRADSTVWRSVVQEPGLRAGNVSLSLRRDSGETVHTLFFADDSLNTLRSRVALREALAFIAIMKRASSAALGGKAAPRPAVRRRPA
ncbi:MAG: hypothetical protein ACT4R6_04800 [Gemmatimonadaceae bacterium]